jgi:hypothetical protein
MQPGQFAPNGEDYIVRRIQDVEKSVQQLAAADPYRPMGITPNAGGFTVTGTETVTGALVVNGTETVNGPLNVNGAMAVTGTLSLPAGIIDNAALANPVAFGQSSTVSTNFALAVTETTFAAGTIPVPAGYTKAQVTIIAVAGALNPNTTSDFLYATALINGVASRQIFGYVAANNGSVEVMTAKVSFLTGLSGGNIDVAMSLSTQTAAWASSGSNRAFVEASAIFLR